MLFSVCSNELPDLELEGGSTQDEKPVDQTVSEKKENVFRAVLAWSER